MEPRTHHEIGQVARLYDGGCLAKPMSRAERLDRWVALLRAEPRRTLQTLRETEFQPSRARDAMRADNSAITVAYEDALLRAEGLSGDTYGDAREFFGLSNRQLHYLVCYCHGGAFMSADTAACRLSSLVPRAAPPGLFRRIMGTLFGRA